MGYNMKALVLILLTITTLVFGAFTPLPPTNPNPNSIITKGGLLTSDGVSQVEALACADGEIIEYDAAETYGFKCAIIPSSATIGEIKEMHTFNGLIPIPRGWMVLDGDVVNEANYDAIHGAGAYVADGVASSSILNKNLPDMIGKYSVAVAATTQDGSAPITSTGNAGNLVDISHTHSGPSHNHLWYDYTGNDNTNGSFNSGGSKINFTDNDNTTIEGNTSRGLAIGEASTSTVLVGASADFYTNNASGTTGSGGSSTQDIQPESIEVIKIMKVI